VLVLNGGLLLLLLMLIRCLLMLLTENNNANAPLLMCGAFVPRIVVLERKVQGPCSLLFGEVCSRTKEANRALVFTISLFYDVCGGEGHRRTPV
jgi:hypothetical protein